MDFKELPLAAGEEGRHEKGCEDDVLRAMKETLP